MSASLVALGASRPLSPLRASWVVARNELSDGFRSRRAAVVLLLYIAVAALTMNVVLSGLQRIEHELAGVLQITAGDAPGAVTRSLWKSETFRNMVKHAVQDDALVQDLFGTPPEALIHGGLSFFYTPLLVILLTAHRISEERASGSARYVYLRMPRLTWVAGKAVGQAILLLAALLMGAAAAWIVARFRMPGMDGPGVAGFILIWSLRSWLYSLAFLGLALGLSQCTKMPALASVFGVLALIALAILSWLADFLGGSGWGRVWDVLRLLSPYAFRWDLWRSHPAYFWPAAAQMLGLGICYLLAGFLTWRRRDA